MTRRALAAFDGERQGAHISFQSNELLLGDLLPEALGVVEVDDRRGRHDASARRPGALGVMSRRCMEMCGRCSTPGVLDRTADGRIVFPYDAVHVDFTLTKADGRS